MTPCPASMWQASPPARLQVYYIVTWKRSSHLRMQRTAVGASVPLGCALQCRAACRTCHIHPCQLKTRSLPNLAPRRVTATWRSAQRSKRRQQQTPRAAETACPATSPLLPLAPPPSSPHMRTQRQRRCLRSTRRRRRRQRRWCRRRLRRRQCRAHGLAESVPHPAAVP